MALEDYFLTPREIKKIERGELSRISTPIGNVTGAYHGKLDKARRARIKRSLTAKNGNHCHYCGRPLNNRTATIDHIIPRSRNGSNHLWNLVLACRQCNVKKGNSILSGGLIDVHK